MHRLLLPVALLALPAGARAQQVADTVYRPRVAASAYAPGQGPVVMIDEAHHEFHTMTGRYAPFARLLQRDGFVVRPGTGPLTAASLAGVRVLVIANALAAQNDTDWSLPTPSAFDSAEMDAVRDWVRRGGSLLLIADHMPFAGAAESLAARFGALFTNGFALDPVTGDGDVRYRRSDGTLGAHPITAGRGPTERIDSLVAFTGQAFRLDGAGTPLLTLPHGKVVLMPVEAWEFSKRTPRLSGDGMLQGAAFPFGQGRVAVFGEAAMFSAQLTGPERAPGGFNAPSAPQNAQFALNVVHWLGGLLPLQ